VRRPSALAAIEVLQDCAGDEDDRERSERQQSDEEQFESDDIHV